MDEPLDIDLLRSLVSEHRKRLGLSLRAAADECDVPFNTLARVEKGHLPDLANFRRIVAWLGLSPERFFQPPRIRTENTPEIIAHHLSSDPHLTEEAADKIAGLVRELYATLASTNRDIRVHLRAATTFTPEAAHVLGEMLEAMQRKLTSPQGPQQ